VSAATTTGCPPTAWWPARSCNRWGECADYQDVYGDRVFVIEYRQQDFDAGCADFPELSIVLRDLDVTAPGSGTYVFDAC
jgi:hypothetical protein